jgi:nucleoside-diphosphate-sugar epimerase
LAEIACGNFSGHRTRPPAKSAVFADYIEEGACGASAAISADIALDRRQRARSLPTTLRTAPAALRRAGRVLSFTSERCRGGSRGKLRAPEKAGVRTAMALKIMILGANGFIGSALTSAILRTRSWEVYGIDLADNKLRDLPKTDRFHFVEGDITINKEWVEYHVKKCDAVVPLVAIANPAQYVTHPLRVFELDFEANLDVVRHCVKYGKRLIFPSTSEIYGMSEDSVLDEETSPLVYGPVNKQRWIYAASKQLLDRVIYAYGVRDNLDYTLFRPFNFIGPNLDNIEEPKEGSSRVFTQFLSNVLYKRPIKLVDGGQQKRSFTYIDDAVEALLTILENKDNRATRRIFNIGNPDNCVSIRDLAERTIRIAQEFPVLRENAKSTQIVDVTAGEYYGKYYQDIQVRVPAIEAAKRDLGWKPTTDLDTAIRRTIEYYVNQEGFGTRSGQL